MSKNSPSGTNPEFELVAPVKILVKPGFNGDGTKTATSSLRRRSISQYEDEASSVSHSDQHGGRGGESGNVFLIGGRNQVKGLRREASVEIETDSVLKNAAYYVDHCLRLMYLTGMSTYNPEQNHTEEKTLTETILSGTQKIVFWIVTVNSIAFAAITLKHKCILFTLDRGVPKIVQVGSWVSTLISEIYYIFLFAFGHRRINETMTTLRKIRTDPIENVGTKKWRCHNLRKLITLLFVLSIFACFMQPLAGFGDKKWSPKNLILDSATKLAIKLFIWSKADFDGDRLPKVVQDYGTELTPVTVMMGLIDIAMRYSSNLKMDTALNIGIVVAILTFLRNRYFGRKLKNMYPKNFNEASDAEDLNSPIGLFDEFKQVVKMENKVLNGLVGGLLNIIHAYSIMQCATLFMRCLDNGATLTEFAFLVYDLIKVAIMYYFGKKAEAENKVYEQWIVEWALHSEDPVFLARAPVILHEMATDPIGLGRGKFLVGQGFIFRFLGFVGSIFMLEVDDDDE